MDAREDHGRTEEEKAHIDRSEGSYLYDITFLCQTSTSPVLRVKQSAMNQSLPIVPSALTLTFSTETVGS